MNWGLRQRPRKALREILCNRSTGNFILHLARAAPLWGASALPAQATPTATTRGASQRRATWRKRIDQGCLESRSRRLPGGGPDRRLGRQRRQVSEQSGRHRAIDAANRRRFHGRANNVLCCEMAAAGFGNGMECGGQHSAMCSDHAWMVTRGRALRQLRQRRTGPLAPPSVVPITHRANLRRRQPGQPRASGTVSARPRAWQDRCPSTARHWD